MRKQEVPPIQGQQAPATRAWLGAGLLAALAASLCCITPILAMVAGVGGVAATFSWLEPLRPFLIGTTLLVLTFAWYRKLKPRRQEEIACACESDPNPSFWQSRRFLGAVTVVALLLLAFPYYSGLFFSRNSGTAAAATTAVPAREATLHIQGMTCGGCEQSVNHALKGQAGVLGASASYATGTATVRFDAEKVGVEQLARRVEEATGYKVTSHQMAE
jgi:mercuric ion transport protein